MFWLGGNKCSRIQQERLDELYRVSDELTRILKEFRTSLRFVGSASEVLQPLLMILIDTWFWSRIATRLATCTKGV